LARTGPFPGRNLTAVAFIASSILLAWSRYRFQFLNVLPIAQNEIIDSLSDGILVFSEDQLLLEFNPGAYFILEWNKELIGKAAKEVLADWPQLFSLFQPLPTKPVERDVVLDASHYTARLSPLKKGTEQTIGFLLTLHDITRLKDLESALRLSEDKYRKRAVEIETLRLATGAVASTLNQEEAIELILDQLALVVPYDSASVQLLHGNVLEIVGGRGFKDISAVLGLRFQLNEDNASSVVFQTRKPFLLEDPPEKFAAFQEPPHNHIKCWLGVPMIVKDELIGIIALDSTERGTFTPDHQKAAVAFADQVAIALENARLFNQTQILAITDSLTGLNNRRHLIEYAEKELLRAHRLNYPISLIMLDIDHFKVINDSHGHLVGDQILIQLAALMKNTIRELDLLGRYGGEEFIIILPHTNQETAISVAERLRILVSKEAFETDAGVLEITISLGVSAIDMANYAYPDVPPDIDILTREADQALYKAKNSGRNQVCVYKK
jgi:diguanylate cyclase (GGDEF)-like protein